MTSIAQVAKKMQSVFNEQANELGRSSGFIKRSRRLSGASFVTALVSDWLSDGETTLNSLSQATANVGTGVSSQALDQRFTPAAAEFMRQMVELTAATVIEHEQALGRLGATFKRIYLQDSTSITLPEALQSVWQGQQGHSCVKIHVEWELCRGGLTQVSLTDGVTHDRQGLSTPPQWEAGSLYLRDLGYFKLSEFAQMSAAGCWWVTRYKSGTTLYDQHAHPLTLTDWLQTVGEEPQAIPVLVGQPQLAAYVVARRATPAETERQQRALRDWERLKQRRATQDRWDLVGWTLYLTNLPPTKLSVAQVATLYRLRWQIERLFRLWKHDLHLDAWRTQNPWRMLCEFYAKLIAAIVQHWCFLIGQVNDMRSSWQRATNVMRKKAWQWADSLASFPALCHTLQSICACLRHGTRISASRSSPTTYQHLRACGLT